MPIISLLLFLLIAYPPKHNTTLKIGILYFSTVDQNLKEELIHNITATYNCTVTETKGIAVLPVEAYYKPRNRYRAPVILNYLENISRYDRIIGITVKDISTTKNGIYDWGIMGLGNCPGKSCVISTFRMKTPNKTLFNDRFIKVALHELGHTLGLPHCTFSNTCFMEDADGTIKSVDRETRFLCSNGRQLINRYIK